MVAHSERHQLLRSSLSHGSYDHVGTRFDHDDDDDDDNDVIMTLKRWQGDDDVMMMMIMIMMVMMHCIVWDVIG